MKKQNGITLIALVITVIVLLILAGITINLTIGQDGILKRAQEAGVEHEKAEIKEELELAILDIRTEKLSQGQSMTREDLMGLEKIGAVMESTGTPAEGEYKDYFFEVDENYEVTIIGKLKGEKPSIQAEVITTGLVALGGKVEIKVTASVSEGNITEIVAPNGAVLKTDTSATEKVFEVSANGVYAFKAKADNGRSATIKVEVNNIIETPQISIKDETEEGFTIVVNNNYAEGLITEYKYYVNGELKSSGTTNKELVLTEVAVGQHEIYVEAYIGNNQFKSNIVTATISMDIESLKAGDYIKYDSGTNGVITCRVLYPVNSQYGLQIISDKNVKDITLAAVGSTFATGKNTYNNAIVILNNEAEKYINEEYAYDARCVGSIPTVNEDGIMIDKDKGATETVSVYNDNGYYPTDTNYVTDQTQMTSVGIWKTGEDYWLASRYLYYNNGYCWFSIRKCFWNGGLVDDYLCHMKQDGTKYGWGYDGPCANGLRPCISLKSDLKIVGGNGVDEDNAYVIGK